MMTANKTEIEQAVSAALAANGDMGLHLVGDGPEGFFSVSTHTGGYFTSDGFGGSCWVDGPRSGTVATPNDAAKESFYAGEFQFGFRTAEAAIESLA
jgi:hypothetical protein